MINACDPFDRSTYATARNIATSFFKSQNGDVTLKITDFGLSQLAKASSPSFTDQAFPGIYLSLNLYLTPIMNI